jgi:hypothetical protein
MMVMDTGEDIIKKQNRDRCLGFVFLLRVLESNQSLEVMRATTTFVARAEARFGVWTIPSSFHVCGEDARHLVSTPSEIITY